MDARFLPLLPAADGPASASARLRILPAESVPTRFQPVSPKAAAREPSCEAPPIVKLQREGERVTRICIQCSCGQVIELNCEY